LRACEQLRDHLIDVRLAGASGLDATAMAAQRSALHASMGAEFTAACQRTMVRTTVQCALAASDGLGLAECEAKGKTR
jgi:uncharacterized metal-binding protein YceD (DUF177 family)